MSTLTRALILRHWTLANARDWDEFSLLLHPDLKYEVPQTREYIDSGQGYLEMFRTWPGNWKAVVQRVICEDASAVCVIDFVVGQETMCGISFFELATSSIVKVTDYWPDPYDPPARATSLMKRRPL
jgi:SnoaL-like domain